MTAFLNVRGVCKRFGSTVALHDVDLEVGDDELVVVLGPTGAGKTTLLRTIAGLERPDHGSIEMAGENVTGADPAKRDVALVFQNFSLYPRWSVRKNLEFPLRAPGRNVAPDEMEQRVQWAAKLLNIERYLDRPASRLSGGEMQRVAIGRAIVRRPRLFLMDEPLTNLDAKLREALRIELLELRRSLGIPMLFVTHDQSEALSMADRIVVLSEGRVLQSGPPQQIYDHPVSPLVALQLGQPRINLISVRRVSDHWVAEDGTPIMPALPGSEDRAVLGIRPEHIQPEGGGHEGEVRVVEYMGPTTTLLVRWAGTEIHIVTRGRSRVRPFQVLRPRVDRARIVVFSPSQKPGEQNHVRKEVRTPVHEAWRADGRVAGAHAAQRARS